MFIEQSDGMYELGINEIERIKVCVHHCQGLSKEEIEEAVFNFKQNGDACLPCGHLDIYCAVDERGAHCSKCGKLYTDWEKIMSDLVEYQVACKGINPAAVPKMVEALELAHEEFARLGITRLQMKMWEILTEARKGRDE